MNLSVLTVWYVLIISTVISIPRRRHTKFRQPVTVAMMHRHQPTALEVLETGLFHGNCRVFQHRRPIHRRNRLHSPLHHGPRKPPNGTIPFAFRSKSKPKTGDQGVDGCVASFGQQSPLCQTRSQIKRESKKQRRQISVDRGSQEVYRASLTEPQHDFKPPGHIKRSFGENYPVIDDFFGVFSTSSYPVSAFENQTQRQLKLSSTPSSSSSVGGLQHNGTIILPGNLAKLQDSQFLFLDSDGNSKSKLYHSEEESLQGEENGNNHIHDLFEEIGTSLMPMASHETEPASEQLTEPPTESSTHPVTELSTAPHTIETTSQTTSSIEHSTSENGVFTSLTPTHSMNNVRHSEEPNVHDHYKTTVGFNHEHTMPNEKHKCMAEHGRNCICSFDKLVEDFHGIFSTSKSPTATFEKVFHVRCKKFVPVPESFELSSNVKPKVLSANNKPMPLDANKGPKELPEKSLEEFLDHLATEEDEVSRVFVNTDVRMPCFPSRDVHLSPNEADQVTYTWTHGNKEAITEGRISENADADGTLAIDDVAVADTDNYTCEVSYTNPDTGQRTEDVYEHALTVVALPVVTVRVTVHYRAPVVCDPGLLEMMELYLPQQLEQAVCQGQGLCTVQLHSPVCYSQPPETHQEREARSVGTEGANNTARNSREAGGGGSLMSLNYEVYLHRQGVKGLTAGNGTTCDPTCHLVLTFRLLQVFRDSMADIVLTPVKSGVSSLSGVFIPLANTVRLRYIFGCVGGYRLDDGFCVACERGHYSEDGWTECLPCPARTYQGRPGARRCISCNSKWVLYCNEYVKTNNILVIVGVVAVTALFVTCLIIYYNITRKHKKLAVALESVRSKKAHRRAKLGASQKRKSPSTPELKRLVEETSGEESDTDGK